MTDKQVKHLSKGRDIKVRIPVKKANGVEMVEEITIGLRKASNKELLEYYKRKCYSLSYKLRLEKKKRREKK